MARAQRKRLSADDVKAFVVAWTKANTREDVAKATGRTANDCTALAVRLRKAGVKLKRLAGVTPYDVGELNKLIETTQRVEMNRAIDMQRSQPSAAAQAIAQRRK
jgi:hypothetical protein